MLDTCSNKEDGTICIFPESSDPYWTQVVYREVFK